MQKLQNSHLSSFGKNKFKKNGQALLGQPPPFRPARARGPASHPPPRARTRPPFSTRRWPRGGCTSATWPRLLGSDRHDPVRTPPCSPRRPHSLCIRLLRPWPLPLQAPPRRHCWPSSAAHRRLFRRVVLCAKSTAVFAITAVCPCARSTEVVSLRATAMARRSSPDLVGVLHRANETLPPLRSG